MGNRGKRYAPSEPIKALTKKEAAALLRASGKHKEDYRNHVLFSLALATGLRSHELRALQLHDIYHEDGQPKVRVALRVFKRSNTNSKTQEVFLSRYMRAKLSKYWGWYQEFHGKVDLSGPDAEKPLFVSTRKKRPLSCRAMRHVFMEWQEKAGFERHLTFHALRHTACLHIYTHTKDLRLTQRFARHKYCTTTEIYTEPTDDDLLSALEAQVL